MALAKKASVEIEGEICTFNFTDETTLALDASEYSEEIRQNLMMHGLKQKGGDSYAGVKTPQEARENVLRVHTELLAGNWRAARVGGGISGKSLLVEAFAQYATEALRAKNPEAPAVTLEAAADAIAQMDDDTKKKVSRHPTIEKIKAQIRLDRANALAADGETSLDDLLGALA